MARPIIVWDIDDVLNNLMAEWFHEFREKNQVSAAYHDLRRNPPCAELGISLDFYLESLDEFRREKMLQLSPQAETLAWFEACGAAYRHIALTAVPFDFASYSAQWLFKYYGNWFREYHFVPSPRGNDTIIAYDESKGDVLKRLGKVDLFIDDNEKNTARAAGLGIRSITFPRPWNKAREGSVTESLNAIKLYLG
ncbi:MAG: hypothetical protein PHV82_13750 [Victivallaceae bacterium]|nr:hypothetical protein [Victivallaceae bacterium]